MSIKKIAQMAGVSVSTAGRVLSDPNHRCLSEEVRQRILQAAREIDYIPNEAARNLKSGNTGAGRYITLISCLPVSFPKKTTPFSASYCGLQSLK